MSDLSTLKSRASRAKTHFDKVLGEMREVQARVEQAQSAWKEAESLLQHALQEEHREQ